MDTWMLDVSRHLYVVGEGAWTTYRVHLYPDAEGWLEVFDEEIFPLDGNGKTKRGYYPATAADLRSELVAFPGFFSKIGKKLFGRLSAVESWATEAAPLTARRFQHLADDLESPATRVGASILVNAEAGSTALKP